MHLKLREQQLRTIIYIFLQLNLQMANTLPYLGSNLNSGFFGKYCQIILQDCDSVVKENSLSFTQNSFYVVILRIIVTVLQNDYIYYYYLLIYFWLHWNCP